MGASSTEAVWWIIDINQLSQNYDINDINIWATTQVKNLNTKMYEGKYENEKYYVMESSRMSCNRDTSYKRDKTLLYSSKHSRKDSE